LKVHHLTDDELRQVQLIQLEMLKEVDRICNLCGIQYNIIAGTLLGAVRHKGYIPWDDDADVMFTRSNYEMFAKVARRELPEGMTFVEPNEYHDGRAFYDFASRIIYDRSQRLEDSQKTAFYDDKISRLCVDLFVADSLPDGRIAKPLTKLLHCIVYGLALGHRYRICYSDYRGMMKLFVFVLSGIGRLIPFPVTYRLWRALCKKDARRNTHLYFYSGYSPDYYYVEMEKAWDDTVCEASFEGRSFYIPSGWEHYLKQVYGDYRKLPPKEKRIPEHSDMEIKIYG